LAKKEMPMRSINPNKGLKGLAAALVATVALAGTAVYTLGGFTASVVNPTNTFASGTLQLKVGVGATTCYSTGTGTGGSVTAANSNTTCAGDTLGGTLLGVPGGTAATTNVTLQNVGNIAASTATLTLGSCTFGAAANDNGYIGASLDFCADVLVTVNNNTTSKCLFPASSSPCVAPTSANTLASLATAGTVSLSAMAAAASDVYGITVQLDPAATNDDQGLAATLPMTWSLAQ
jgi:hypothetical protein